MGMTFPLTVTGVSGGKQAMNDMNKKRGVFEKFCPALIPDIPIYIIENKLAKTRDMRNFNRLAVY